MGAPTEIEVSVDDTEYSRYEPGRKTITATVTVTGGAPYSSEEVTVDLVKARKDRDAVVATATLSFTSNTDPQEDTVEFYLPDIVDQDLIHLVRHGMYFVRATSDTDENIVGESDDFWVSVVTVERLKNDFLFGIDLSATEIREPKFQPQEISGITVTETSRTHSFGSGILSYIYHEDDTANATATIGSGANGEVTITADNDLTGKTGNNATVEVTVPSSGTSGLSVSVTGDTAITVQLAVNSGVLDPAQNTATLVASAIDSLSDFSAVASGTGADSLSSAEGPTQFSGGATNVVRQLSWDGGPLVSIKKPGTYILMQGKSGPAANLKSAHRDYITVRVKSTLSLPTENVVEELLIERKNIDDTTLRNYINQSIDWVEKEYLATPIEPTNVVTERDPTTVQYAAGINAPSPIFTDTDFDLIGSPLTYFVPKSGSWVSIQFPWPQLLRIDSLYGAIANTRVIDIDLEWIEISEQGGLVQLVPFNQEIAFDFVGLLWVNALRGAVELPNFWHYNAIVGLRDTPPAVQELVAKKAAIDALTVVGMALRPGVGSVSLSRDGVSESVSYTTSAQFGVFTGTIQAYKDWIDEHGKELRAKYRGPTLTVV